MWAVSLTGPGTDSIPAWSGVPALFPGVPMNAAISTAVLFQNLQPVSTECNGLRTVANGRIAALSHLQVRSFSSIGIIKVRPARRMVSPIMSVSWRNAKTVLFTPSRVIPAIAADSANILLDIMRFLGTVFQRTKNSKRKKRKAPSFSFCIT